LGQQFIVENVTGAGGTIGSTRATRARPDGYTILMGDTGTHAFSVSFYPSLAYKPDVDFESIGAVLEFPFLIVARKDLPPRDLKEFIAYVKRNAEQLNVGHAGFGSPIFTYALLLNLQRIPVKLTRSRRGGSSCDILHEKVSVRKHRHVGIE